MGKRTEDIASTSPEFDVYAMRIAESLDLPKKVGLTGVRLGLQMLEVGIFRVENNLPIDDFMEDTQPQMGLPKVREAYRRYVESPTEKTTILDILYGVNGEYIRHFVAQGYTEEMIRATGMNDQLSKQYEG